MTTPRRSRRRAARSGQAIVLVALAMIALLAFVVLAVDGGNFYNQRRMVQNAADVSSLAGLHFYYSPPTGVAIPPTNALVLGEIVRVAGINQVPSAASNVKAYWLDINGNYLAADGSVAGPQTAAAPAGIDLGSNTAAYKPATAVGLMVRPAYSYNTFFGAIIGRGVNGVQADGVAMQITIPYVPDNKINYDDMSVWLGGGGCGSTPSFDVGDQGNSNNFDFGGDAYIGGSGIQGHGHDNQGLYKDKRNPKPTVYFSGDPGTLDGGNGNISTGWVNPYLPDTFPGNFYYQSSAAPRHLLQAEDFRPSTDAAYTQNYVYRDYLSMPTPANYFHNILNPDGTVMDYATQKSNSRTANGDALQRAMNSGVKGVYFVDGDVQIDFSWDANSGMGVVATGKVWFNGGGASSPVGKASEGWGFGISVLAGGSPASGKSACAAFSTDAGWDPIFIKGSQQASWAGTIYVPNGLADLSGNFNNGHSLGPVIANAMSTGDDFNANNQNFGPCDTTYGPCFPHPPTYTYDLHK